ncbi:uncharacterized protein BDZ99DRAFT_570976 [Mytilinidion resinicola]|uniref:BTB domain-containing protein n=1 Tax=Mytilinidion resinicola TaxID=574789 RepID=A0A6A6YR87_9PEZI|nr:uncharacterized protein BDZ99DRAFT_570976 [Mytilinidion resinicola]KAF2810397.1 hypothetical protein BDZ99DRAFT_570976 [Mytilinidion resinicola]
MGSQNVGQTYGCEDYYWSDLDSDSDSDKPMSGHSPTNLIPGDTSASAQATTTNPSTAAPASSIQSGVDGDVGVSTAATTLTTTHTSSAPNIDGNVAYPTLPTLGQSSSGAPGSKGAQSGGPHPTLFGGEHTRGKKRARESPPEETGSLKKPQTASRKEAGQQPSPITKDHLLNLLRTGQYSDYCIKCADIGWRVHLMVLTDRASGLLPPDFSPGSSCTITEHSPIIIESCLEFAYSGDYSDPQTDVSASVSHDPGSSEHLPLHHHILLFGAAAAFEMPDLMTLTLEKFQAHYQREGWNKAEYEAALRKCREVYSQWEHLDDRMMLFFHYIGVEGIRLESASNLAKGMEEEEAAGDGY